MQTKTIRRSLVLLTATLGASLLSGPTLVQAEELHDVAPDLAPSTGNEVVDKALNWLAEPDPDALTSIVDELDTSMTPALVCIVGDVSPANACLGTGMEATDPDCLSWGHIGVRVSYATGSGEVRIVGSCDQELVSECTATQPGVSCVGDGGAIPGKVGCRAEVPVGNPGQVQGECYDPIDPTRLVPAVIQWANGLYS